MEEEEETDLNMDLDEEQCHGETVSSKLSSKGQGSHMFVYLQELDRAALICRARLGRIDAAISQLQLQKESLTKQLDARKYSVLTLPNELVAEIFIHALDRPSLNGYPLPTVLAQVCCHWRNVALSLPMLWRTISLKLNSLTLDRRLMMAKTWFRRSGRRPLSLTLKYGPDCRGVTHVGPHFPLFIRELSPQFSRLEHLDVGVTLRGDSLELLRHPMPQLKHLALTMNRVYTTESPVVMSPENVPLLRSLELRHFHPYHELSFPWEQITTLICDHIEYRDLCKILEQSPALLHCAVSRMQRGLATPSPVTLPRLESLIFSLYDFDDSLFGIFPISHMTLPALRILQIPETYLRYPSFDALLAFVSRSRCSLEELRIIDLTHTSEQAYIDKFSAIPSLSFYRQSCGITV